MFQRAYNVRLYPNKQQEVLISKTYGCCRKVYNCMLEAKIKSYEATSTACRSKPTDFYTEFPFLKEVDVRAVAEGDHAKSEHDTAWRMFLNKLQYKAEWYVRTIVRVGRWFPSSQLCHCCGFKNTLTKDLNVRSWTCPQCGTSHDRDVNAAINILSEGKRVIAAGTAVKGAGNIDTQREAHCL